MWISLPEHPDVGQVLSHHEVHGPDDAHQVEGQELAGLVELGVLDLGQVKLTVHLVQEVLLKVTESSSFML